jgi:LuxR family maltose regulon positive regulatory protein
MFTKRYGFIKYFRQAAVESRQMGSYVTRPPVNCFTLGSYVCRVMEPSPEAIEKYTTIVKKIVPYTVEAMGGCMSGFYELVKGELAFFRGEFDDGEQFLLEALKKGHARNQYEIENRALFYLLRMYISGAKLRGIEDVHRKLDAELREPLFLTRYAHYDIVTSWYNVQIGRIDRIAPWLKSGYKESDLNMRAHNLEKLVKAKYAIHEKRCPAAIAILQNRGEDEPFLIGSIEIKVLEAVCHYRLKEKEKAFRSLIEAYELAEPSGLFFPFVEQGKDMRNLAGAMLKEKNPLPGRDWLNKINREASSYAKKLFIVAEHNRAPKGDTGGEASLLSRREIEVLKGLSEGLTREEIAGVSSISINTVKSAVRSIFNKLGAVNRADAVRIAEEKNILRQE